ncbi:GNAT family N-acetyltransferase [Vibrio parahaemolyticus]|uniref:GNAT family N-acetyltransferase n=1 Tax=Vibrio parahaemolyticus TaxID=670 RepID=UPI00111D6616|nr:GNAT family N-acetyltransferase [Vibrio parahaemolyticus]TOD71907.1 GNAT family N-acetyltransferase [Vibrio parahaemolyticus]
MTIQPTLTTERLVLRPFNIGDCQQVALLDGDKRIADMTANIPHPYELPMAQAWIDRHYPMYQQHQGVAYAITLRNTGELLGAVSLPRIEEGYGTLGYWVGVPHWGKGYAFEASKALLEFARMHFELNGITVMHLVDNLRSKSVIQKLKIPYVGDKTLRMQGKERKVCVYQLTFVASE